MKRTKFESFEKLFPWFVGLSADQIFYVVIGDLFLAIVKGYSAADIVSLTTYSLIISMIIQVPLLMLIKKIGNNAGVRIGAVMMFLSSVLIAFCDYTGILIGKVLYETSFIFNSLSYVMLKNNLHMTRRDSHYLKIRNRGNAIYAILTLAATIVGTFLFNLNPYIPMIASCVCAFVALVLSFQLFDYSLIDKSYVPKSKKVKLSKLSIFILAFYMLFFVFVYLGTNEGKLAIQYTLLEHFSDSKTTTLVGVVFLASRIARLVSSMIFDKIVNKIQNKTSSLLAILTTLALVSLAVGALFNLPLWLRIVLMSIGYVGVLFIRDPGLAYIQNIGLDAVDDKHKQNFVTIMEFGKKLLVTILCFGVTLALNITSLEVVLGVIAILSIIELIVGFILVRMLTINKAEPTNN